MINQFNVSEHITQIKTKRGPADYLAVKWRLVWFRDQCPEGSIDTELVMLDTEKQLAVFRAKVFDGKGASATSHGSESVKDFEDYIEKAETKAIGRALAALGYGTQFAPEMEEGERIADAPVERTTRDQALHELTRPGPARMGPKQVHVLTNGDGTPATPKPYTLAEVKALFGKLYKPERWEAWKVNALGTGMQVADEGLSDGELDTLHAKLVETRKSMAR